MSTPASDRFDRFTPFPHPSVSSWSDVNAVDSIEPDHSTSTASKRKPCKIASSLVPPPPVDHGLRPAHHGIAFPEEEQYDALIEEFTSTFNRLATDSLGHGPDQLLNGHLPRAHRQYMNPANVNLHQGEESEASTRPCTGHGDLLSSIASQDFPGGFESEERQRRASSSNPPCKFGGSRPGSRPVTVPGCRNQCVTRPFQFDSTPARIATASELSTSLLPSAPEWQAQFYKTKLCPFYVSDIPSSEMSRKYGMNIGCAKGSCLNGQNCRFAHSFNELRPLPDLKKTKLCSSYTKKTVCRSPGCPFAHSPQELRTSSSVFYKVTLCNFYKNQRCWNGPNCRFAHGSEELRASPGESGDSPSPSLIGAHERSSGEGKSSNAGSRPGDSFDRDEGQMTGGGVYESFVDEIVKRFDESTTRLLISALTSKAESGPLGGPLENNGFAERRNIERSLTSETPTTRSFNSVQSADVTSSDFLSENDFSRNSIEENGKKCDEELLLKCIIDDLVDASPPEGLPGAV